MTTTVCAHCNTAVTDDGTGGHRVCPRCGTLQPRLPARTVVPGTEIDLGWGRIVIDARLGEGGMGIVWRGWLFYAPTTPRASEPPLPIALKVLAPVMRGRPEVRALFLSEAEALRHFAHPNVVRFHAIVTHGEDLAIAMEYVDGDTLEEVIARHVARARLAAPGGPAMQAMQAMLPAMPFQRAWYYFQQLLGALAAVHALGFVHRDVKPSNVIVRRDGIVKLGDFGIAQLGTDQAPRTPGAAAAAHAGGMPDRLAPGTGAYMSPEQVLSEPLDGRSDLYSAGIVLYEMLTGRTPFVVEGRGEFLVRHDQVTAAPPPVRAFLPQAPPVLDALFARALAKDRAYRFASAIEMGDAFRGALGIPESPEWRAQQQLATEATQPAEPQRQQRIETLRDFLVQRYRTARMERV
jgi:serine/threonine-protein kinase